MGASKFNNRVVGRGCLPLSKIREIFLRRVVLMGDIKLDDIHTF